MFKHLTRVLVVVLCLMSIPIVTLKADPFVGTITPSNSIIGPFDTDSIGSKQVLELPSGNLVIVSDNWNSNRGAVTCLTPLQYQTGGIVIDSSNSLTGSSLFDSVGSGGVTTLTNGDYVVISPNWNGIVGAVTWVDGQTCIPHGESGVAAVVSASNSLTGSTAGDGTSLGVTALTNGNYVMRWSNWDNAATTDVGAVAWADGDTGLVGLVSTSNALVGTLSGNRVGSGSVQALSNGHYVVTSPLWDSPIASDVGAVTWGNGATGIIGDVSAANSLVGSTASDGIGSNIIKLTNGNYVTYSKNWDNGGATKAGAVTWADMDTGVVGVVSASNSLVGTTTDDKIGSFTIALTNGNYVTASSAWDNGGATNVGAVTWGSGTTGITGAVSTVNSFVGDATDALVGDVSLTALTNGNYVIVSDYGSSQPQTFVGAVTLGDGTLGLVGTLSPTNSLIGSSLNDLVGDNGITALPNGNFVVRSPNWNNDTVDNAGAATWCDGDTGCAGMVVSATNSLVGSTANDAIGSGSITVLTNGNYVLRSDGWDNGNVGNTGAITWGNKDGGIVGAITAANSLVGTTANDSIGNSIRTLSNGNYVAISYNWDNGADVNVGAVTWGNGLGGTVGALSPSNSLVGSTSSTLASATALQNGHYIVRDAGWNNAIGGVVWANGNDGSTVGEFGTTNLVLQGSQTPDKVGLGDIITLSNGDYVVGSDFWVNGTATAAGAATLLKGDGTPVGVVSPENSIVGSSANDSVGKNRLLALSSGGFLVVSNYWDNGAGAITYNEGNIPVNLLTNPSFETAGATGKQAASWTVKNAKTADRRLCITVAKPITTADGQCVFQFNTSITPGYARSLKQILTSGDLGVTGQTLSFSAMVEANKLKLGTKIVVTATYADSTTAKFAVNIPKGTYAFTELTGSLNLTQTVTKIVVNINAAKVIGRVRLDSLNLTVSNSVRLAFPSITARDGATTNEPAAPDGFRK